MYKIIGFPFGFTAQLLPSFLPWQEGSQTRKWWYAFSFLLGYTGRSSYPPGLLLDASPLSKPSVMFAHVLRNMDDKRWFLFLCFLGLKAVKAQWSTERTDLLQFPKGKASFRTALPT